MPFKRADLLGLAKQPRNKKKEEGRREILAFLASMDSIAASIAEGLYLPSLCCVIHGVMVLKSLLVPYETSSGYFSKHQGCGSSESGPEVLYLLDIF